MFIGEYHHSIDEKSRLSIPVKFRNVLKDGAVITRGLDNCLYIYTKDEWLKLAEKLAKLPISKANTRAFARLMLAGAMDVEPDSQGRVVLPEYLRDYGKLGKNVVITGLYSHLEVWDEKRWQKYTAVTEKDSNSIAEGLEGLDL